MGEPTIEHGEHFVPGTVLGFDGEPFGPLTPSPADEGEPPEQDAGYEEAEDLDPDTSKADAAVQAEA